MALKSHATIIDDIQDYLGANTTDFTDALTTKWIAQGLNEFSRYCPNIVRETFATTEDSKELSISEVKNRLWIDALEFRVGKDVREWRNFTEHYGNMISMDINFYPSDTDSGIDTNEAVDASETAIDVTPTATSAIPVGTIIRIDNELMYVTATGTTLTVARGYSNTTASTHTTATSIYKPELAYLYFAKSHKIPALSDLAGAVDLSAGYAAEFRTIHVDNLGASDVLEEDWTFTIASDSTSTHYRLTQDTTLSSSEGDITFEPGLAEAVANDDVLTFDNSTLTPAWETLFIDLVAARAAISTATKFIQGIPQSGRNPYRDYIDWWQRQLIITLGKLENEAKKYRKPYTEWTQGT
jgi:hypothetical protein